MQTCLWMEQRLWGRDGDEEEGLSLGIRNCINLDSFFGAINQLIVFFLSSPVPNARNQLTNLVVSFVGPRLCGTAVFLRPPALGTAPTLALSALAVAE